MEMEVPDRSSCEWCSKDLSINVDRDGWKGFQPPGWCSLKCETEWKDHSRGNPDIYTDLFQRQKAWEEYRDRYAEYLKKRREAYAAKWKKEAEETARFIEDYEMEKQKEAETANIVGIVILVVAASGLFGLFWLISAYGHCSWCANQ